MADIEQLEVKLSKFSCLFIGSICFLFLVVGLDLMYFRKIFDFTVSPEKQLPYYGFLFFAIGCGGAGFFQVVWYFFFSPTLARIDERGITFAVGFRYNPYFIPGKFVKSAGRGVTVDLTHQATFFDLVKIEFHPAPEVPSGLVTSMGVGFEGHCLGISWFYRDTSSGNILNVVNGFLKSGVWGRWEDPTQPKPGFQAVSHANPLQGKLP